MKKKDAEDQHSCLRDVKVSSWKLKWICGRQGVYPEASDGLHWVRKHSLQPILWCLGYWAEASLLLAPYPLLGPPCIAKGARLEEKSPTQEINDRNAHLVLLHDICCILWPSIHIYLMKYPSPPSQFGVMNKHDVSYASTFIGLNCWIFWNCCVIIGMCGWLNQKNTTKPSSHLRKDWWTCGLEKRGRH